MDVHLQSRTASESRPLLRDALADGDIREYGFADGLRGVEGVKGMSPYSQIRADAFGFP